MVITARIQKEWGGIVFPGVCMCTFGGGGYPHPADEGFPHPAKWGAHPADRGGTPSSQGGTPIQLTEGTPSL